MIMTNSMLTKNVLTNNICIYNTDMTKRSITNRKKKFDSRHIVDDKGSHSNGKFVGVVLSFNHNIPIFLYKVDVVPNWNDYK